MNAETTRLLRLASSALVLAAFPLMVVWLHQQDPYATRIEDGSSASLWQTPEAQEPALGNNQFTFYEMLPNLNVDVPTPSAPPVSHVAHTLNEPVIAVASARAATPAPTARVHRAIVEAGIKIPAPQPSQPVLAPRSAVPAKVLQAGSYRQAADAERQRVELLMIGLDARIERAQLNGSDVYRILVAGDLRTAKQRLQQRNIAFFERR